MAGSEPYTNFADQLLSWEECEPLIGASCAEAGLPAVAAEAVAALPADLLRGAAAPARQPVPTQPLYRAFRELGRAIRTIVLLRYLSEPELREGITAITTRVEAFHGFARWLSFGGVLGDNDPDHHEKIVKFNELLALALAAASG